MSILIKQLERKGGTLVGKGLDPFRNSTKHETVPCDLNPSLKTERRKAVPYVKLPSLKSKRGETVPYKIKAFIKPITKPASTNI